MMTFYNLSKRIFIANYNNNNYTFVNTYFVNFSPKSYLTSLVQLQHNLHKLPYISHAHRSLNRHLVPVHKTMQNSRRDFNDNPDNSRAVKDLKLMNFNEKVWPSPLKTLKNYFLSFLIRNYMDDQFTLAGFLRGARQAVARVSFCISTGNFEALDDLVTRTAIREIRQNYNELTDEQRRFISVDPQDIFLEFVYEIGMIFEDNSRKKFVEITTVMQGFHGLEKIKDENVRDMSNEMIANSKQLFVCNYRFIREFTKGSTDDWKINKLNHFTPRKLHN